MTLLAFAADRRAAVDMDWKAAAAIDWYKLPTGPTVANPPHAVADRQKDGHRTVT